MSYSFITISGIKLISSNGTTPNTNLPGQGGDIIFDNFHYIAYNLANTRRAAEIVVVDSAVDLSVGTGKAYFYVPSVLNGKRLVTVNAIVITEGSEGTSDIQISKIRAGNSSYMLSTKITIDSGETSSSSANTPAVIDVENSDVITGDILRIDIDAVSVTPPKGLIVTMEFE